MTAQIHPPVALAEASEWFALLAGGEVSDKERLAWQHWLTAHPDNAKAWQQVEAINGQFGMVTGALGHGALQLPNPARRLAMKHVLLFGAVGLSAIGAYRTQPWQGLLADVSTRVGEQQRVQLADGTQLHLNTDSAVNVVYNDTTRLVELLRGEVHIQTAHDRLQRPFMVNTRHGVVIALGTRFNVRDYGDYTRVSLFEGRIQVNPAQLPGMEKVIDAGQSLQFGKSHLEPPGENHFSDEAWIKGKLIFNDTPLAVVAKELSRYRRGIVRCDAQVASLPISGVLPIADTNEALRLLAQSFPVRIQQYTPFWTVISAS